MLLNKFKEKWCYRTCFLAKMKKLNISLIFLLYFFYFRSYILFTYMTKKNESHKKKNYLVFVKTVYIMSYINYFFYLNKSSYIYELPYYFKIGRFKLRNTHFTTQDFCISYLYYIILDK